MIDCPNCEGGGDEPCPDCDGGYYDCPHCGREMECDSCDGSGYVECWQCDGTGEIEGGEDDED